MKKPNDMLTVNPLRYRGYYYDSETGFYYLQSRYYDPELGRFINADDFASTGQGILGNNMFAYCNNNPATYADPEGNLPGGIANPNAMGYKDGTKNRAWYPKPKRDTSFVLIQEQSEVSGGTKIASFFHGELDFLGIDTGSFNLMNFEITAISLDLVNGPWTLSLFNLGNVSLNAGLTGMLPYAGAMVSLWSPTIKYQVGDTYFAFTLHLGALGREFKITSQSNKVTYAPNGFGFSIAWS